MGIKKAGQLPGLGHAACAGVYYFLNTTKPPE